MSDPFIVCPDFIVINRQNMFDQYRYVDKPSTGTGRYVLLDPTEVKVENSTPFEGGGDFTNVEGKLYRYSTESFDLPGFDNRAVGEYLHFFRDLIIYQIINGIFAYNTKTKETKLGSHIISKIIIFDSYIVVLISDERYKGFMVRFLDEDLKTVIEIQNGIMYEELTCKCIDGKQITLGFRMYNFGSTQTVKYEQKFTPQVKEGFKGKEGKNNLKGTVMNFNLKPRDSLQNSHDKTPITDMVKLNDVLLISCGLRCYGIKIEQGEQSEQVLTPLFLLLTFEDIKLRLSLTNDRVFSTHNSYFKLTVEGKPVEHIPDNEVFINDFGVIFRGKDVIGNIPNPRKDIYKCIITKEQRNKIRDKLISYKIRLSRDMVGIVARFI